MPDAGCRMPDAKNCRRPRDGPQPSPFPTLLPWCDPDFFTQRRHHNFSAMSDLEFMWQVGSRQELIPGIIYARLMTRSGAI